jgi:hypothetical protein
MVYCVNVCNLLDRWFFFDDLENFLNFMKNSTGRPIPEIVCEWNDRYAKKPNQHVFCSTKI